MNIVQHLELKNFIAASGINLSTVFDNVLSSNSNDEFSFDINTSPVQIFPIEKQTLTGSLDRHARRSDTFSRIQQQEQQQQRTVVVTGGKSGDACEFDD